MKSSGLLRAALVLGAALAVAGTVRAEPPDAPSEYLDSIERQGTLGGEEDEVDAGEAQAERFESTGRVPGVAHRQAKAVEEIVVQARRRTELLEDTPISVTALSQSTLREAGVQRLDDIQTLVPNLTFQTDNTGAATNIRIRGVGTSSTEIAFDPGVGVYVDGVYLPRSLGTLVDIVDVQQVEVLRGPQGTLFGKNTVGGAINITTVKPSNELEGFAMLRPGNFGRVDTRMTLNVPVVDDRMAMRVAFATVNTPGYAYNVFRDESLSGRNSLAFLGALRLLPHEDVAIDLTGTWTRDHNDGLAQRCAVVNRKAPLAGPFLPPGTFEDCESTTPFVTTANVAALTDLESYGTWMVANWDVGEAGWLGDISVKSLTSWREQRARSRFDVDGTHFQIVQLSVTGGDEPIDGTPGFQRQIMQEGQLNGAALDDRLNYVAGAFGFWETGTGGGRATYVLPPGQGNPVALDQAFVSTTDIDNWTWALFGQATYDVLDWLSLTAGVRYTQDKKGLAFQQVDLETEMRTASEAGDKVFEKWTPMASVATILPEELLDQTPLDHVMAYFTYSEGFKGGGFNGVATGPAASGSSTGVAFAYGPETLDNFEIGAKLVAFDQRVTLNTSFFLGEYDDLQVTQIRDTGTGPDGTPTVARVTDNAARGTTKGFEVELLTTPAEGLLVTGNVGYTYAIYDDFADGLSDFDGTTLDRSGERFLFTPRLQTFVAVQYSFPLPALAEGPMQGWFTPRVEWAYTSSIEWLGPEVPQATQAGYNLLNARFSYDFWDDRAQVALWAKNLLDEAYFYNVTPIASTFGIITQAYAAPRTYGAELSWRF